ncbi:cutinase family protein [Mycolicibacterium brumae]|nr:hypothetical protein MBRU_05715 [Mycolicibacterium brumae DSM 44177]
MATDKTSVLRNRSARLLSAVSAVALGFGLLTAAPAAMTAVASAADCPDIEVVFARGTSEGPGVGRIGNAFINDLRGMVGGRSVGEYAVNYPADYDFLQAAGGANDASAHIQWMMANCPATRLVLGGYSQGAAVVDAVAALPFPGLGFDMPLPANAVDHVAAIAVFGNPTAKTGMPLTMSPTWGSRTIDLCNPGDIVCDSWAWSEDVGPHRAYDGGPAYAAAQFVAARV